MPFVLQTTKQLFEAGDPFQVVLQANPRRICLVIFWGGLDAHFTFDTQEYEGIANNQPTNNPLTFTLREHGLMMQRGLFVYNNDQLWVETYETLTQ